MAWNYHPSLSGYFQLPLAQGLTRILDVIPVHENMNALDEGRARTVGSHAKAYVVQQFLRLLLQRLNWRAPRVGYGVVICCRQTLFQNNPSGGSGVESRSGIARYAIERQLNCDSTAGMLVSPVADSVT